LTPLALDQNRIRKNRKQLQYPLDDGKYKHHEIGDAEELSYFQKETKEN